MPVENKKPHKLRKGGATIVMIGVTAVVCAFAMLFLDILTWYDYQYTIEARIQRAINSTVEYAMDDTYRADGYNVMDVSKARNVLYDYLYSDLGVDSFGCKYDSNNKLVYQVTFGTPIYSRYPAGIEIKATVCLKVGFAKYFSLNREGGITWTNSYKSTNFRTDDDSARGDWSLFPW
jgi:hypothetical protein